MMCFPTRSKAGIKRLPQRLGAGATYRTCPGGGSVTADTAEVEDDADTAEKTDPPSELDEEEPTVRCEYCGAHTVGPREAKLGSATLSRGGDGRGCW